MASIFQPINESATRKPTAKPNRKEAKKSNYAKAVSLISARPAAPSEINVINVFRAGSGFSFTELNPASGAEAGSGAKIPE